MAEPKMTRSVPLDEMAAYRLIKLGELALKQADEALIPLGLSAREFNVLAAVDAGAGRSQQVLSSLIGINPTIMVSVIDRLEGNGLIERRNDPSDRRRYLLAITDDGRSTVNNGSRVLFTAQDHLLAGLDSNEREQLTVLAGRALAPLWPPK